ncbi:AAA family ATPase [Candidatus Leptofilum sp.]|uniref:AAA family ATPase n=1 Tax=Candidatus Leptofilum sp. TaxID=3241576 RepID=UPI003B58C880
MYLHSIVSDIDDVLPKSPFVRDGGSLLMMVGLPGTGKSSVVEGLAQFMPFVVVSTDGIRLHLRNQPTYTAAEMMLVYEVCYAIIESRLREGQRVIFDGSNYLAARREHLMKIGKRAGAPVAVCYVQAAQETIRERLFKRNSGQRRKTDLSDADWSVYKWMVEAQEPVVGEHLILDTTDTPPNVLAEKLFYYWLKCEETGASDPDIQSSSWARQFSSADGLGR